MRACDSEGVCESMYFARLEVGELRKALHLCWANDIQEIPILDLDIAACRCFAKHFFCRGAENITLDTAEGVRDSGGWKEGQYSGSRDSIAILLLT